ncbi:MAG: AAA family ATPase [Firmicutes bacterium]|nr:AAA family ATPase [Bacillota bacterium]
MGIYKELMPEELINKCDCEELGFKTTEELEQLDGIIGQERAASSMKFGLAIKRHGYNIFVSGLTGTGRSSYSRSIVKKIAAKEKTPDDWCYVYNFKNPEKPKAINLSAGKGSELVEDMDNLVDSVKEKISKVFQGEDFEKQRNDIINEFQKSSSEIMDRFNAFAKEQGFLIKRSEQGLLTIPVIDGKPIEQDEYMNMEASSRKIIDEKSKTVQKFLKESMKEVREIEKSTKERINRLESGIALLTVEDPISMLVEKYKENDNVVEYLKNVQNDMIKNISDFRSSEMPKEEGLGIAKLMGVRDFTIKYKVNLVVNNKYTVGAPVIIEANPKYYNLLGRIEYESNMGVITTNFTKIVSGSLHSANGGFLIVNISDIAKSPESWDGLKRALSNRCIAIENVFTSTTGIVTGGMKPEPIPLDLKVILIGSNSIYHILYNYDDDFRKLFKIKADFDTDMEANKENIRKYAEFIRSHAVEKDMLHFKCGAVASVVEYSRRLAEHKHKLSTRFNDIVEVLYEADAWARLEPSPLVKKEHVKKAIEQKIYRSGRIEEKLQELIDTGVLLISTQERVVGQVNGLSVMNFGDYSFGKPSRITATVFVGEEGIVNIEREVEMSGRIHNKGVLILSGYLGDKFSKDVPLSISANICFEQLYDGVEGDSASSTELYALLSGLSGVPIKQYIAVTGSVNQKGEIQPIGGVNEKIEGFFQTCKHRGLTGNEGVIIPHQNVVNLMLNDEVIKAVEDSKFHIYPVETIEEGIEILTDVPAGNIDAYGNYKKGTLYYLVKEKIKKYAEIAVNRKR